MEKLHGTAAGRIGKMNGKRMAAGVIYGIIEDVAASWVARRFPSSRQGGA